MSGVAFVVEQCRMLLSVQNANACEMRTCSMEKWSSRKRAERTWVRRRCLPASDVPCRAAYCKFVNAE